MSLPGTFALAVSLSMDSFAAALTRGAAARRHDLARVLGAGALFAATEVAALSAGWGIGQAALGLIAAIDHWIAFALLLAIGGRMIHEGLAAPATDCPARPPAPIAARSLRLVGTAIATSIDAAAVGVSMAVTGYDFPLSAAVLGGVTFAMACGGALLGRRAGPLLGRRAEIAGGVLLIAVGVRTLIGHLYG
jgi:putative Mn2+ efflux pump MntP